MKNSKLIRVLRGLRPKEWRELDQFLQSPYFNKREDVRQLYHHLLPMLKEEVPMSDKESIHTALFPDQSFRLVSFDLLMSYLYRLVCQFIQQKEMMSADWEVNLRLAEGFRKRGLTIEFNQSIRQLQKQMEEQPLRNGRYFQTYYDLKWAQSQVLTAENPTNTANMVELTESMDVKYFSTKLQHACLAATHRSIYQTDPLQISLLPELLTIVQQDNYLKVPCIAVYYYAFQMLQAPEEEDHFAQFKNILFSHDLQFSPTETRNLYLLAINYCVRQANGGKQQYLEELLELYQQGLQNKALLENGVLSRFTYHNAVGVALGTGQDEWTERFINEYKSSLEKKYRESSYSFNRARLAYSRKNYDGALVLLQKSNYRDLLLNLAAKTLLLKIYYEIQENDLLYSHLEAMQKYLSRKRVIGYHKTNYHNIISYTKKLLAVNPFEKKDREKLVQQIQKEKVLTERPWFLAQLST